MRDIAEGLGKWRAAGVRFALATVVRTFSSAPRGPGAAMAVAESGEVIGSVSGGCVEGAVYDLALSVLETGEPVLQRYGVSDDDAFAVGLTCGGIIDILVERADSPEFSEALDAVLADEPVALVHHEGRYLVVRPSPAPASPSPAPASPAPAPASPSPAPASPSPAPASPSPAPASPSGAPASAESHRMIGDLGDPGLTYAAAQQAVGMLAHGRTGMIELGTHGEQRMTDVDVFVQSFNPPPRMLVFGAIDFASAVARIGKFLGYYVVVCDARPVFATRSRFPDADEIVVAWPHRYLQENPVDPRTVICVLTHDPKFDVPLLQEALRTPAKYIGVMGNRRTHEDRMARLRELGIGEEALARLAAPIGLDLGARTPEETAIAIAAEIVALTWNGTGRRLSELETPIHR